MIKYTFVHISGKKWNIFVKGDTFLTKYDLYFSRSASAMDKSATVKRAHACTLYFTVLLMVMIWKVIECRKIAPYLDNNRAKTYCVCSRCGGGCLIIFVFLLPGGWSRCKGAG